MKTRSSSKPAPTGGFSARSLLAPAIVAVPLAVVAWWLWPADAPAPAAPTVTAAAPSAALPALPFASGAPVIGPDRADDIDTAAMVRPPSVSDEEWQQLRQLFARFPQRDAALAQAAQSLSFQMLQARFQALKAAQPAGSAASPQLLAVARTLDQALPGQMLRGEIDAGAASTLKTALLEVMVADPGTRAQQLASFRDPRTANAAAPVSAATQASREAEFQRLRAQAVAAWNALPPDQRDPGDLEAEIADLRDAIFNPEN